MTTESKFSIDVDIRIEMTARVLASERLLAHDVNNLFVLHMLINKKYFSSTTGCAFTSFFGSSLLMNMPSGMSRYSASLCESILSHGKNWLRSSGHVGIGCESVTYAGCTMDTAPKGVSSCVPDIITTFPPVKRRHELDAP